MNRHQGEGVGDHPIHNPKGDIQDVVSIVVDGGKDRDTMWFWCVHVSIGDQIDCTICNV